MTFDSTQGQQSAHRHTVQPSAEPVRPVWTAPVRPSRAVAIMLAITAITAITGITAITAITVVGGGLALLLGLAPAVLLHALWNDAFFCLAGDSSLVVYYFAV